MHYESARFHMTETEYFSRLSTAAELEGQPEVFLFNRKSVFFFSISPLEDTASASRGRPITLLQSLQKFE